MANLRVNGNVVVIDNKQKKTETNDSVKNVPNSIIVAKNGSLVIKICKNQSEGTPSQEVSKDSALTDTKKPKRIKLGGGSQIKIRNDVDGKNSINVINIESKDEGRYELSWEQIGNSALNSAKKFVKGMFCDEKGFSIKRTAMTVGIVAGLAFAAPAAAALGASTAVVGLIANTTYLAGLGLAGYMAYHGGKAAIENGQKYYEAKNEAEAKQSMDKAMEGAVEVAAALPAFWAIKAGANKGIIKSLNRDAAKKAKVENSAEPKPTEVKPTETAPEPKPVPEVKPAETNAAPEPKPIGETKPAPEPKPTEVKPAETSKPQGETKPEAKPTETQETQTSEPKPTNPREAVGKSERITSRNGMIIERSRNTDGNIVKDVVTDANNKYIYTKDVFYTPNGEEVGYSLKWANGTVDVFLKGSNRGSRTMPDGSKYLIELKDNKIHIIDAVKPAKPNAAQEKPPVQPETTEAKPIEVKPAETPKPQAETKLEAKPTETKAPEVKPTETKPVQETKPTNETKPAEETKIDYNKIVGEPEISIVEDGSSFAYFYNAKGEIVKTIFKDENVKVIYESTTQFDNIGQEVKSTFKFKNYIKETFSTNGEETKVIRKWSDGIVEELSVIGKNLYEGVRTYPDGRKVRIKADINGIKELGPVEANGAKPAAEAKPTETKAPEVKPTQETKPTAETSKTEQSANSKVGASDDFTLQMQEVKSGLEKMMAIAEDPAKMKLVTDPKMKSALEGFNDHANVIKQNLKKIDLYLNEGKATFTVEDHKTLQFIIDILTSLD